MAKRTDDGIVEVMDEPSNISLRDLVLALKALKGDDEDTLQKRAKYEAEAHHRLTKRENETHPGVSAYNPLGDVAHPRPDLKCRMFWIGYQLEKDSLTREEIDLLNLIDETGKVPFTRADGSRDELVITGERNAMGGWERLEFMFPARGEKKHNLPSMTSMLREALGLESIEAELRKRVARLESQLAKTA